MTTLSKPIALVGMMGSGKSTVGKILAEHFNAIFIDTDAEIVKKAGKPIAAIFSEAGEPAFRAIEQEAVIEALASDNAIIATGGGCVVTPAVLEGLKTSALMVWLKITPEQAYERIKGDKARPLLQTDNPLQKLKDLLAAREPLYAHAKISIDAGEDNPQKTANQIIEALSPYLN